MRVATSQYKCFSLQRATPDEWRSPYDSETVQIKVSLEQFR